jgi:hypothetical protein
VNEKQVTTYTALPQASSCRLVDFKTLPVVCRGETYGLESLNRQGSSNGLREASFRCWFSAAPTRGSPMRDSLFHRMTHRRSRW